MLEDGGRVCIVRDITWRKRSEERLQRSERFLNTIFNSIRDPFCIFDNEFRIIRVNEAYAQLKNKSAGPADRAENATKRWKGGRRCAKAALWRRPSYPAIPAPRTSMVTLEDGAEVWVEIYTYPILDEHGRVSHVIEYTRDITDRKKSEDEKRRLIERLEYLSRTDSLTGLINRRALTRQPELRNGAGQTVRRRTGADPVRHRQLQGDQRYLRPRHGRPGASDAVGLAQDHAAEDDIAGPLRRGRVHAYPARDLARGR